MAEFLGCACTLGQANKDLRFHKHSTAATNMVRVCEHTCRADVRRALAMIPIFVDNQSRIDKAFQKRAVDVLTTDMGTVAAANAALKQHLMATCTAQHRRTT